MRHPTPHEARLHRHGNIFAPHSGSMIIHAQRENGFAHRTLTLRPWQVQALRLLASRWAVVLFVAGLLSWGYFAVQAARVPVLLAELRRLEQDSARLDSLRQTVTLLQGRYEQIQRMLAAPVKSEAPPPGVVNRASEFPLTRSDNGPPRKKLNRIPN